MNPEIALTILTQRRDRPAYVIRNSLLTTPIRTYNLSLSRQIRPRRIPSRPKERQILRIDGQPRQYQNRNRSRWQPLLNDLTPHHRCPTGITGSVRARAQVRHTARRVHEKVGQIVAYPTRPYADNDAVRPAFGGPQGPPLADGNPASRQPTANPQRSQPIETPINLQTVIASVARQSRLSCASMPKLLKPRSRRPSDPVPFPPSADDEPAGTGR